ncbi:putative ATP-dependent RNA helicase DDX10 [Varanus komodoensis]|nr:putative ATP-dependent RNA helicase DDX10 [Varanus komodoensis]
MLYLMSTSNAKTKKKITKTKEAKKILKRKFKVNTKIVFTEDGELIQQWPPAQKYVHDNAEDDDSFNGINLDKAKERLQAEDKFDKEEYRKKIKEKHREKRLKEKAARREARKRNAKVRFFILSLELFAALKMQHEQAHLDYFFP